MMNRDKIAPKLQELVFTTKLIADVAQSSVHDTRWDQNTSPGTCDGLAGVRAFKTGAEWKIGG
jgi:hypothetical protein